MTSRDYNVLCYTRYYPVLSHHVQYQFEPGNREQLALSTREVTTIHSTVANAITTQDEGHVLKRECRKWAVRLVRETKAIQEMERRLNSIKAPFMSTLYIFY